VLRLARRWWIGVPLLVLGAAAAWWIAMPAGPAPPAAGESAAAAAGAQPPAPAAPQAAASGPRRGAPLSAQALADRREQLVRAHARLDRAKQSLASYRLSTRYPYDSRPAGEHGDQWIAHPLLASDVPLRVPGGTAAPGVHIHTTQQAVFVSGSDAVTLTVAALDDDGNVLPLRILRSVTEAPVDAQAPQRTAPPPAVTQLFVDDGTQGDARAGDGTWTTRLQPAGEGFAGWGGLVRTELTVLAAGTQGYVAFDVIYAPETPATWAGPAREALEDGSLVLTLPVQVMQPGRYVVTGRVDDGDGKPFALLSFNEELAAGPQVVVLTVWGRLVRDLKPAFPLTLHDVDGFLLKPDAFPDRALMPPRDGVVLTTRKYAIATFSDAVWQSEETARYVGELGKDVDAAQSEVDRLESQVGP
jgi:hypothetical protein